MNTMLLDNPMQIGVFKCDRCSWTGNTALEFAQHFCLPTLQTVTFTGTVVCPKCHVEYVPIATGNQVFEHVCAPTPLFPLSLSTEQLVNELVNRGYKVKLEKK